MRNHLAPAPVATIFTIVKEDLAAVEQTLTRAVEAEQPLMRRLLGMVLPGSGKRLRPALALLCGRVKDRRPEPLVSFAAALEMLHTATLVHDDIVDLAEVRRGVPTLNVRTSNSIAVLVGDYMFAQAAAHTAATNHLAVIADFAQASMTVIGGQIDEAWSDGGINLTVEQYYRRIGSKTAALFALAAQGGARLSGASDETVQALWRYGYQLGLAFQVADDILDVVGDERTLGKPVGSDIRQGTVTLPAILVRDEVPAEVFRSAFVGENHREESIEQVLQAIRSEGVERSYSEAERLTAEARESLRAVPAGEVRDSLADLTEFVVRRSI